MNVEDIYIEMIKKDKIIGVEDGFHWKSHGRTAMIYLIENNSIIPIGAEMSGVKYLDVLIYGETQLIKKRYYPKKNLWEEIPIEDRFRIQALLVNWLNNRGLRHNIQIGE